MIRLSKNFGANAQKFSSFVFEIPPQNFEKPSNKFTIFCIYFLSLDWILFGSMHFTMHSATANMIPYWIPLKDAAVIITGIFEVLVGFMIHYLRARRAAALLSMVLLILLFPAVFHILSSPTSLPWPPSSWQSQVWRLLLIPHTIFMMICSIHLFRFPFFDSTDSGSRKLKRDQNADLNRKTATLFVALTLLLCNAAGFLALILGVKAALATASMWMIMCLAAGGLVGFLFAVPKINEKAANSDLLMPNKNIEAMSDWLTKIIVGLGLLNFREIIASITQVSVDLSRVLQVDKNFVFAMIIYFWIAGFLEGYLITRMFIQRYFEAAVRRSAEMVAASTMPISR